MRRYLLTGIAVERHCREVVDAKAVPQGVADLTKGSIGALLRKSSGKNVAIGQGRWKYKGFHNRAKLAFTTAL